MSEVKGGCVLPRCESSEIRISVIIPVYNSAAYLQACLQALAHSTHRNFDIIVVDDGSMDGSAEVAQQAGAQVLVLSGNRGASYARNRGAEVACGEVLLFVDADVCVHPDTLERVEQAFAQHPEVTALMGSYDEQPGHPSFLSQYKNLFHHYVHQQGNAEASTFWTGCGAVRRETFLALGGFHESWNFLEDVEFGSRLRRAGCRIRLENSIQVQHLKQWTLRGLVWTDVFGRGVPWVCLMLRDQETVRDLNLSTVSRLSVVLTYLILLSGLGLVAAGLFLAALPTVALLAACTASAALYDSRMRWIQLVVLPLGIGLAGWGLATSEAAVAALAPIVLLFIILSLNVPFYRFFARVRGPVFACGVVPCHLLFCVYSGVCIPLGILHYLVAARQARKWGTGPGTLPNRPLIPRTPAQGSPALRQVSGSK